MDEQLLDSLAHQAYEIEEEEEHQMGWQQYCKEQKKKSEQQEMIDEIIAEGKDIQWREQSLTQYAKDSGFVDEMEQLEQMQKEQKEWITQIANLATEINNAALIEQKEQLERDQKQQKEEELLQSYSMDQFDTQVSIDDAIKSIEQHNHVLQMDDVKEEVDNSVKDQQLTKITQEKIMDKYIQEKVQIDEDFTKWYFTQVGKQNTNPFFFDGYSRTNPCSKPSDK